jgi:hypothetical protein
LVGADARGRVSRTFYGPLGPRWPSLDPATRPPAWRSLACQLRVWASVHFGSKFHFWCFFIEKRFESEQKRVADVLGPVWTAYARHGVSGAALVLSQPRLRRDGGVLTVGRFGGGKLLRWIRDQGLVFRDRDAGRDPTTLLKRPEARHGQNWGAGGVTPDLHGGCPVPGASGGGKIGFRVGSSGGAAGAGRSGASLGWVWGPRRAWPGASRLGGVLGGPMCEKRPLSPVSARFWPFGAPEFLSKRGRGPCLGRCLRWDVRGASSAPARFCVGSEKVTFRRY